MKKKYYGRYSWPTLVLSLIIIVVFTKDIFNDGLEQKVIAGYIIAFVLWLFLLRIALAREYVEYNSEYIASSYMICGISFTKSWNREGIAWFNYDGEYLKIKMKSGKEYSLKVKTIISNDEIALFNKSGG